MMKSPLSVKALIFPLALVFLFPLAAQSPQVPWGMNDQGQAVVAVLPLAGEETDAILRFHHGTKEAVAALGKYEPRDVYNSALAEAGLELPTDMPPNRILAPGARYALTGGVYPGARAGEFYLQLWLWDLAGSTMIYTDDLVYDEIAGALESLPGLVEWLFSHIHEAVIETAEPPAPKDYWFMTGVKAGLSPRWYISPGEDTPGAQGLNLEGGVFGALRLNSLLALQLELLLTGDVVVYRGLDWNKGAYTLENEKFTNTSLTVPFLLKLNFKAGPVRISPMAGFYVAVPLGKTKYRRSTGGGDNTYGFSVPLGFAGGLEGALPFGPGKLLAGLRYSMDFGYMTINSSPETRVRRNMLSIYLGYEFGFFDRNRRPASAE
ncbi:MAG: PorT family protein [Treponema sp.]|jgi:hypothetical protein|nr:PorT family protein [Treponema sp.]